MGTHSLVILFDVLDILAVVLLLFTLIPAAFSKGVQQSIGWYNLMSQWMVVALGYVLLIGWQGNSPPPHGLCILQTLLVYAIPPLAAAGLLCYFAEFYLIVSCLRSGALTPTTFWRTFWLTVTPWLVFLVVIAINILLIFPGGTLHLVNRAPTNFYCHSEYGLPSIISGALVSAIFLIVLPLEVWTGALMYCNWSRFRELGRTDLRIFRMLYVRLATCTLIAVAGLVFATSAFTSVSKSDERSLSYPFLPIAIGVAFGTQKDILRAWLFWRPSKPYGSIIFNNGTSHDRTNNTSRMANLSARESHRRDETRMIVIDQGAVRVSITQASVLSTPRGVDKGFPPGHKNSEGRSSVIMGYIESQIPRSGSGKESQCNSV